MYEFECFSFLFTQAYKIGCFDSFSEILKNCTLDLRSISVPIISARYIELINQQQLQLVYKNNLLPMSHKFISILPLNHLAPFTDHAHFLFHLFHLHRLHNLETKIDGVSCAVKILPFLTFLIFNTDMCVNLIYS